MRKFVVIVVFVFFSMWIVSADLSDWLFCLIKKTEVTISLKQTFGYYRCKDTIVSLQDLIIGTAKDLMKIQSYINRGRDIEYRKAIKMEKRKLLDTLQLSRLTILTNMQTFESTLLQKSVKYFIIKITPYTLTLQKSLAKIQSLSGVATPEILSYARLLETQITTLDLLSKATTTTQLNDLLAKYLYLKKEIEWKSE